MSDDPRNRAPGPSEGELSEDLISAYLDDELDPSARRAVEERLAEWEPWRVVLDEVRAAREAVRSLPVREPPAGFWERLRADLGAEEEPRLAAVADVTPLRREPTAASPVTPARAGRRRPRVLRWAAAAAAVAAAAALFVVPNGNKRSDVQPSVSELADTASATQSTAGDPISALVPVGMEVGPGR